MHGSRRWSSSSPRMATALLQPARHPLHVPDRAALTAPPKTRFVPRFVTPTAEQIRSVLRESHSLWGAGLSVADYVGMWEELADSRWGRAWYSWRALVDEQDLTSPSCTVPTRLGHDVGQPARSCRVHPTRVSTPWAAAPSARRAEAGRDDRQATVHRHRANYYRRSKPLPALRGRHGSLPLRQGRRAGDVSIDDPDDIDAVARHGLRRARSP
jgi:hypothetical protein